MKKCAITLEYCQEIGGSNAFLLDVANVLKEEHGYEIMFYVFQLSEIVKNRIETKGHKVIDLLKTDPFSLSGSYDLIWGAHWPVLGTLLLCGNIEFQNLILHSMSPFVDFERIFMFTELADIILFNSHENYNSHKEELNSNDKLLIFPNALPESFFMEADAVKEYQYDFSYVGNHYTPEIVQAFRKLQELGYKVRKTGRHFGQTDVDEKYIDSSRVIVTIGHTVLKAIGRKRNVYVYDRFGGPGYLLEENFEELLKNNFSGRYNGFKNYDEIVDELINKMPNLKNAENLYEKVKESFNLNKNIRKILERLENREKRRLKKESYRSYFILSYSYYAQRAGLKHKLSHSWFTPVLDVSHYKRRVNISLENEKRWKFIKLNYPEQVRAANNIKSLQLEVFILHDDIEIEDVIAKNSTGKIYRSIPRLSSPQVHSRFKEDKKSKNCRYIVLLPVEKDDSKIELYARGRQANAENKEEILEKIGDIYIS